MNFKSIKCPESGESLKPSNPLNEFTFNDDTNVLIQKLVYKGENVFALTRLRCKSCARKKFAKIN